jgi:predicted flap endonuclease-1-like 5' DNA nuclease
MSRKSFWLGFLLAVIVLVWWIREQSKMSDLMPWLEREPAGPLPPRHGEEEPDPLEEITGIGPVFANRLRDAGIRTFHQLATLPPERIREIAQMQPWQGDVESWIEQARERAR